MTKFYAIMENNHGIIWCATKSGIAIFNSKKFTGFPIPFSETEKPSPNFAKVPVGTFKFPFAKAVSYITQSGKGTYWLGTFGSGLFRLEGKKLNRRRQK